jgi:hypothetical protein
MVRSRWHAYGRPYPGHGTGRRLRTSQRLTRDRGKSTATQAICPAPRKRKFPEHNGSSRPWTPNGFSSLSDQRKRAAGTRHCRLDLSRHIGWRRLRRYHGGASVRGSGSVMTGALGNFSSARKGSRAGSHVSAGALRMTSCPSVPNGGSSCNRAGAPPAV